MEYSPSPFVFFAYQEKPVKGFNRQGGAKAPLTDFDWICFKSLSGGDIHAAINIVCAALEPNGHTPIQAVFAAIGAIVGCISEIILHVNLAMFPKEKAFRMQQSIGQFVQVW